VRKSWEETALPASATPTPTARSRVIEDHDSIREEDEIIASLKEHKMSFGPRRTESHATGDEYRSVPTSSKLSNYVRVASSGTNIEKYPTSPKARKIMDYLDEESSSGANSGKYPTSPKARKIMAYLNAESGERPLSPKAKSISTYLDSVTSSVESFTPSTIQIESQFFDSSSTATKGRFRLNEPKDFDAKTLHLDSHPTSLGISMLMGVKLRAQDIDEKAGMDNEKVVTLIFDKTMFTEVQAMKWWLENKSDPLFL